MVWGIFKADSVSEAYKKMKAEELKGNQHKLDADKDGKIEGEDLAKLRAKKEQVEHIEEAIDAKDYHVTSEKSKMTDGHRPKVVHKTKGTTMHLSQHSYKSPEHAKAHAQAYLDAYSKMGPNAADRAGHEYASKNKDKRVNEEVELEESHFAVGDKVKCKASGMSGKVVKLDKDHGADDEKYYTVKRNDGKEMKYAPNELSSIKEEIELEEEKDLVKSSSKEIKHVNIKDKDDDKEDFGPTAQGERDFLDKLSVQVTDDPARNGHRTGADKVKPATKPVAKGPGTYDAKSKLGIKEGSEDSVEEACGDYDDKNGKSKDEGTKAKGKKTFSKFKEEKLSKGY